MGGYDKHSLCGLLYKLSDLHNDENPNQGLKLKFDLP